MKKGLPELGSVSDLALFNQNYFVVGKTGVRLTYFKRFIQFYFIPTK